MDSNKTNCLVIIPAMNEEATIAEVICQIAKFTQLPIVVIDDCSTDNTIKEAEKAGATVLKLALPLGAWGATQTGLRYALQHDFDCVVTIDGDGQHDPETIPLLVKQSQDHGSDIVIAADIQRGSWQRKIAWRFFKFLTGLNIDDLTSGFRAYSRKAISILASADLTLLEYQDIGVLLMVQKKELLITEIPTVMSPRTSGHSRIFNTWGSVARYLLYSLIVTLCRRNKLLGN